MKNKKGFVFIETIITIVVLASLLLYIYTNFNNILIKEKTRIHYDNVSYIYQTFYVKEYFSKLNLAIILNSLKDDNPIQIIGCYSNELVPENEKIFCESMINNLYISNIAVSLYDLDYIQNDCVSGKDSLRCEYLNNFSREEQEYLKTLGNPKKDGYMMIIEYSTDKDGKNLCNGDGCIKNYAWVNI